LLPAVYGGNGSAIYVRYRGRITEILDSVFLSNGNGCVSVTILLGDREWGAGGEVRWLAPHNSGCPVRRGNNIQVGRSPYRRRRTIPQGHAVHKARSHAKEINPLKGPPNPSLQKEMSCPRRKRRWKGPPAQPQRQDQPPGPRSVTRQRSQPLHQRTGQAAQPRAIVVLVLT
jgi:hypothetical protein